MTKEPVLGISYDLGVRYATFEVELFATPKYAATVNQMLNDLHLNLEDRGATGVRLVETQRVVMPVAVMQMRTLHTNEVGLRVAAIFEYSTLPEQGTFDWPNWSA